VNYFEYQPPTKLIEYLACNKPVIATNTIAQEEIIGRLNYLVHSDDLESTKEKIQYFIENIYEIKNTNFSILVKNFRWKKLVEKIKILI